MRNNSDREKLECLGTLLKVHQLVFEDKRDPLIVKPVLKQVKSLLQPIIDKPEEVPESGDGERKIIDALKHKTSAGEIEWVHGGYGGWCEPPETLIYSPDASRQYELCVAGPGNTFKSYKRVYLLRLVNDKKVVREIHLTNEDKKFFYFVYEKVMQEQEEKKESFLDKFIL